MQRLIILRKGLTTRRAHWHTYRARLKWVNQHSLTFHEGVAGLFISQTHKPEPADAQTPLLVTPSAGMPRKKTRRAVVARKIRAESHAFQGELFGIPALVVAEPVRKSYGSRIARVDHGRMFIFAA